MALPGALSLKPDWLEARKRMLAWWRHEPMDRPCLGLVTQRDHPSTEPPAPDISGMTPEDYYFNAEARIAQTERFMADFTWIGEAFPNASIDLGPGSLALYLGSEPGYSWDTIWFHPWPPAAEGALPEHDPNNPIWTRHQALLRALRAAADGRYMANIPDIVEGLDIVASLRGNDELLFDLFDNPQWVHACMDRVTELYFTYYDRCYDICKDDGGVSFTAFQVWGPGRTAKLQCDFAAMIGPDMFAEYESPYLARMCERLDYSVYHWDGPTAIPHLDNLIAIPKLNAIQWTPGAGAEDVWSPDWHPLYQRALAGGKSLLLMGPFDPTRMDATVRACGGPRGLYLSAWGAPSEAEAHGLVQYAEKNWK
jgi:5-methyltetrahydrofolate--homocysteine methyltransferase